MAKMESKILALPLENGYPGYPAAQDRLVSPLYDFLLIGGISLLLYPFFFLIPDTEGNRASWGFFIFLIAFVINYPHFAFSYQLFYKDFRKKITGQSIEGIYRLRYIFAGIVVPLMLFLLLSFAMQSDSPQYLHYSVRAMFFFVGWHYVKQGYGVFIVTSLLQKVYYTKIEKYLLLFNSYIVWLFSWSAAHSVSNGKYDVFYSLNVPSLMLPDYIPPFFGALMLLTFPILIYTFIVKYKREKKIPPLSGIVGYLSALYLWLILHNNQFAFYLIAPAFHSLQYILFIWRFKTHEIVAKLDLELTDEAKHGQYTKRLYSFICLGALLGGAGFVFIPYTLNAWVPVDAALFGPEVFTLVFAVFINIHHYFLDNILWRKDNKEAFQYLLH